MNRPEHMIACVSRKITRLNISRYEIVEVWDLEDTRCPNYIKQKALPGTKLYVDETTLPVFSLERSMNLAGEWDVELEDA